MKLAIVNALWKRKELNAFVLEYYNELKTPFELIKIAAISPEDPHYQENKKLCEINNWIWINTPNNPLSQKFNKVILHSRKFKPDAVMLIGSDDIITREFFLEYHHRLECGYDFLGCTDIFFLTRDKLHYFEGYTPDSKRHGEPIGPGKVFSKRLLNMLKWQPWSDLKINRNLDGNMMKNLREHKYTEFITSCVKVGGYIIDIKTDTFISDIREFKLNGWLPKKTIVKILPKYRKIRNIVYKNICDK